MLGAPAVFAAGEKLVLGHQMAALPRYGTGTPLSAMRTEVQQWKDAGLDGVLVFDVFDPVFQDVAKRYHEAALLEGGFKIGISPGYIDNDRVRAHVEFFKQLATARYAGARLMKNGKYYLSAYHGSTSLASVASQLQAAGIPTFVEPQVFPRDVPANVGWEAGGITAFTPATLAALMSNPAWQFTSGFASFYISNSLADQGNAIDWLWTEAKKRNKSARGSIVAHYKGYAHKGNWMAYESWGFARLRSSWQRAIASGIPAVEFITLNDMSESSYINSWAADDPTILIDHWNKRDNAAILDHSGFRYFSKRYIQWFKTGVQPAITQDELYYAYRLHPRNATSYFRLSAAEKAKLKQFIPSETDADNIYRRESLPSSYSSRSNWNMGLDTSKLSDAIHVAVRLKSPADVYINGVIVGSNLPAGEHLLAKPGAIANGSSPDGYAMYTFGPSDYGRPRFEIRRGGKVVASWQGELEITPYVVPGCWNMFARRAPASAFTAGTTATTTTTPNLVPTTTGTVTGSAPPVTNGSSSNGTNGANATNGNTTSGQTGADAAKRAPGIASVATRARAGMGDDALTLTFVISGNGARPILIRGIGPTLAQLGVSDALRAMRLQVFRGQGVIAQMERWDEPGTAAAIIAATNDVGAMALPRASADTALFRNLNPATYTVRLQPRGVAPAVALLELYDAGRNPLALGSAVTAVSSRARIGGNQRALTLGFTIEGSAARRVLLRGVGPGLKALGVSGGIADPRLELFAKERLVAQNDNWDSSAATNAAKAASAFALPASSKDAALVVTLAPGVYTAEVEDAGGADGLALVEVYLVP